MKYDLYIDEPYEGLYFIESFADLASARAYAKTILDGTHDYRRLHPDEELRIFAEYDL